MTKKIKPMFIIEKGSNGIGSKSVELNSDITDIILKRKFHFCPHSIGDNRGIIISDNKTTYGAIYVDITSGYAFENSRGWPNNLCETPKIIRNTIKAALIKDKSCYDGPFIESIYDAQVSR